MKLPHMGKIFTVIFFSRGNDIDFGTLIPAEPAGANELLEWT